MSGNTLAVRSNGIEKGVTEKLPLMKSIWVTMEAKASVLLLYAEQWSQNQYGLRRDLARCSTASEQAEELIPVQDEASF